MNEASWNVSFSLPDAPDCFRGTVNGSAAVLAERDDDTLTLTLFFRIPTQEEPKPLAVRGICKPGDEVSLVFRPWRMELWINGMLADEEWPWGCWIGFEAVCSYTGEAVLTFSDVPEEPVPPTVLDQFTGAEGWYPGNGVFAGDCMPFVWDGRYHLLYLKDRHHHGSKWGKGAHQWEHLSTDDLLHWNVHPMAVAIEEPWEGSICTGSWILENGIHQLYYTIRTMDGSPAPVCRSLSEDGYHYHKDKSFRFVLSDRYTGASARDPKVIRGDDGRMHMFVTTSLAAEGLGCLAHLISSDGESWTELEPIYVSPDANEPECSDYFHCGDYYYLIFSHYARAQYRISTRPFTDWITPTDPIIPCSSVPKAGVWNGRILFAGFKSMGGYAGSLDFMEAVPGADGILSFRPIREWM